MQQYRLTKYRDAWCAVWTESGRMRRAALGASVREADRQTAQILFHDWVARVEAARNAPAGPVTLGTILVSYFQAKPSVVFRPQLVDFFRPHLAGNVNQALIDSYTATRAGKAASTIRSEVGILSTALHWARKHGLIERVPAIQLPPASPPRERWITKEEANRLLEAAISSHVHLFILLARYTGARAGAILDLTWERVTDKYIDYNDPTKARSRKKRAVVPVHPDLREALADARKKAMTPYVIEYGGEKVASVKKAFGRAVARAGLEHVGPHTLRHSAATWMAMDGVPFQRIAAFLGNSVKMVEGVYAKYSPDYLADAVNSLGRGQLVHLNQNRAHKQATRSEKLDLTERKVS